jgi:hypothetical protein
MDMVVSSFMGWMGWIIQQGGKEKKGEERR